MRRVLLALVFAMSLGAAARSQNPADLMVDYRNFQEPPAEYRGHRWFTFRLSNITDATVVSGIQQAAKSDSFGSFMIRTGTPQRGD